MATNWNKFNSFVDYLCRGKLNLATDTIKVVLTNTAPQAGNSKYSDVAANELANGNGYTTGGITVTGTGLTNVNGTETLTNAQIVITANTGDMGPFRYVLFVDTTSVDQPLIGYYDYGSSVTLKGSAGENFTINTSGALLTVS